MSLVPDNVVKEILAGEMDLMVIREDDEVLDEVLDDIQGVTDFVSTI
jgi:peroxiredoxin family protein